MILIKNNSERDFTYVGLEAHIPGFNIGGGAHADQKSNIAEPRRKHRWAVTALSAGSGGDVMQPGELVYLQKAARPNFKYDTPEMHHDQEEAWFAGKQHWEPITWTFYDIEDPDLSQRMREWVGRITQSFNDVSARTTVALPSDYKGRAVTGMYGGGGDVSEEWVMYGVWPESTNWNDLDYTSTDLQTIEVTIRLDKAVGSITV